MNEVFSIHSDDDDDDAFYASIKATKTTSKGQSESDNDEYSFTTAQEKRKRVSSHKRRSSLPPNDLNDLGYIFPTVHFTHSHGTADFYPVRRYILFFSFRTVLYFFFFFSPIHTVHCFFCCSHGTSMKKKDIYKSVLKQYIFLKNGSFFCKFHRALRGSCLLKNVLKCMHDE